MKDRETLGAWVPAEVAAEVRAAAKRHGITVSQEVARRIVLAGNDASDSEVVSQHTLADGRELKTILVETRREAILTEGVKP